MSVCLCRRKALCEGGHEEARVAGYIAMDSEGASVGRFIPCGLGRWTRKVDAEGLEVAVHISGTKNVLLDSFHLSKLPGFSCHSFVVFSVL